MCVNVCLNTFFLSMVKLKIMPTSIRSKETDWQFSLHSLLTVGNHLPPHLRAEAYFTSCRLDSVLPSQSRMAKSLSLPTSPQYSLPEEAASSCLFYLFNS